MEHAHNVGDAADRGRLVRTIMRRQAGLALRIAAVFVLVLIGLPLLNLWYPGLMATKIGGFSLTWLLLAILFYPVTWLLSWAFVKGSDRIEAKIVAEMRGADGFPTTTAQAPAIDRAGHDGPETIAPPKKKLFVEEDEA